jgi:hypothetical protein
MSVGYVGMFAFGLLLLAAWTGWGAALERLVVGRRVGDRALHAGWGLAWALVIGGGLNLMGWIGPLVNGVLVATGIVFLAGDVWRGRHRVGARCRRRLAALRQRPALAAVAVLIVAMLLLVYAVNVCSKYFNPHDDLHAYLVFPTKMIQTGTMGPEPFSERRLTALGGQSFLHSLVLSVGDWRSFELIDPGVSILLAAALVAGLARDARARPWVAALAVFLLLLVPPPRVNVTSLVSGLVLFLTLFRTLSRVALRGRPSTAGAVLVGLVAAGVCSLKSTYVPACAVAVAGAYGLGAWRSRRSLELRTLMVAGLSAVLLLAPWMISMYQSSGTPLFPFLGPGFYSSAYGRTSPVEDRLTLETVLEGIRRAATDLRVIPVWILGASLFLRGRLRGTSGVVVAFFLATLATHLALVVLYPEGAYRYSWGFLFACLLVLVVHTDPAVRAALPGGWLVARAILPAILALGVLLLAHSGRAARFWARLPHELQVTVQHSVSPGFKARWVRRYARMQWAVPRDAVLLSRLQYPFALDFTRQTVYIADHPGGASPPPGMPVFEGSEALAAYLCSVGVNHVAYSYQSQAGFSRQVFSGRLDPQTHPWVRNQARFTFDFQASLEELGRTRHRLYDDGDVFVVDLGRTSKGEPLACSGARPVTSTKVRPHEL